MWAKFTHLFQSSFGCACIHTSHCVLVLHNSIHCICVLLPNHSEVLLPNHSEVGGRGRLFFMDIAGSSCLCTPPFCGSLTRAALSRSSYPTIILVALMKLFLIDYFIADSWCYSLLCCLIKEAYVCTFLYKPLWSTTYFIRHMKCYATL